jgi:dTDP-4-amino-4,6-dideoxygalactose transaminase
MNIPFLSFNASNDQVRDEMTAAFSRVFESKWYVLGDEVKKFETQYSEFNKVKHTIGVSNGLDALFLSLKALGIGAGDEVIVPSNTYIASWLAVSYTGATPVPAEPNPDTMNIDVEEIRAKITSHTKAIMPVHLYGQSCEMDPIMELAESNGFFVIEDNAQAQGATCNGKLTGTMGHVNATSFYPGKNLGALGDAGAVTTNDDTLAQKIRVLRNYGSEKKYFNSVIGYNMRLDEMQAAFLQVKLNYLGGWNEQRKKVAGWYSEALSGIPELTLPSIADGCTHVYHLFVIRAENRDALQGYLQSEGVGTMIHYPVPPHLQEAFSSIGLKKGQLPIAESIAETCLSLPIYPGLVEDNVRFIADTIRKFYRSA